MSGWVWKPRYVEALQKSYFMRYALRRSLLETGSWRYWGQVDFRDPLWKKSCAALVASAPDGPVKPGGLLSSHSSPQSLIKPQGIKPVFLGEIFSLHKLFPVVGVVLSGCRYFLRGLLA